MNPRVHQALGSLALLVMMTWLLSAESVGGQQKTGPKGGPQVSAQAWTLEEAMSQLSLYPKDAYLQYVVLQLARREQRLPEVTPTIDRILGNEARMQRQGRLSQVDLFSIFTGALAVQESLQLDTMRGEAARRPPRIPFPSPDVKGRPATPEEAQRIAQAQREAEERQRNRQVEVASLTGPTIKSHPWKQMLAGKQPKISPLAKCVPGDFYFVEFRSVSKMLDVLDANDLWGMHLFNQATQEARTQQVGERLKTQLAVETNKLLRPFYDLVVEEAAVTGSDLFVAEGSDVTILFRFKQPAVFKARMDGFLRNAGRDNPTARQTPGEYRGVKFIHLGTPDRRIQVYSAYPQADLHVRSNSLVGLKRVLDAIQGKTADGEKVSRLGDTDEFAFIRTLMPEGATEEDGFVYLSDPFIRHLVGPELKLTERRRMLCYNHLRMIGHAALLFRTEYGRAPTSLAELSEKGCAPGVFGTGELVCPNGGLYGLSTDGMTGQCSHHGQAHCLTPCCEIPVKQVRGEEADEYKAFLEEYNRYWRTFFDPIALRIQVTPQRYRMETIVLPLIDNSVYSGLAMVLGGKTEPLDALPVPKRNIFSVAVRVNKEELLRQAGMLPDAPLAGGEAPKQRRAPTAQDHQCTNNLRQIALAMHNYHDSHGKFPPAASLDKQGKPLLSWRVQLLPYLEQEPLYRRFHLNEPWDSPNNKLLVAQMPAVYRCPTQKPGSASKTTYLAPVGKETVFPPNSKDGARIASISDGTSNTIMIVEADEDHAVEWTKPDDWLVDLAKPLAGLSRRHVQSIQVVMADGSVRLLRDPIEPKTMAALLTRAGGEVVQLPDDSMAPSPRNFFDIPGVEGTEVAKLAPHLQRFLTQGIGNQVGMHVYDSVPLVDFSLPSFLGFMVGAFGGGRGPGGGLGASELGIAFLVSALNAPTYVSVPVKDSKVVDEFLVQLDTVLARISRMRLGDDFLRVNQDFYQFALDRNRSMRVYNISFGPIKWRLYWGRIGDGLYLASKPFILEDLMAMEANRTVRKDTGPAAHGMLRLRPEGWNQVLPDYRLGWAENDRVACVHNHGPLASLARAVHSRDAKPSETVLQANRLAEQLLGVHMFCPEGGNFELTPDGKSIACSVHGSALAPRQQAGPSDKSTTARALNSFAGMTVTFSFLEDGLHAVVTVDRK